MLRRINENRIDAKVRSADEIAIKDAAFPKPFPAGLEFNAPVHGTWNIVHIGMQVPESIQIYVCAQNCMRGVVLTAAEMNEQDRFSFVILSEKDMVSGDIEEITIKGVIDVLEKRKSLPKAVLLFTVCAHHFLGCDYRRIYRELENRFPEVDFMRCYMDPIMQKQGLTPDQKLRRAVFEKLPECPPNPEKIAVLGNDFSYDLSKDIFGLLASSGYEICQSRDCMTYEEFLSLADAGTFFCTYPPAKVGAELAAKRLERKFFYLPATFNYELIEEQIRSVFEALGVSKKDSGGVSLKLASCREAAESSIRRAAALIGNTPIAIDHTVHPRPLGLVRFLIEHGFLVDTVYLDAVSKEEEADFYWLKEHASNLKLSATIHVLKRIAPRGRKEKILAIGQKAAWFEDSPWFVNMVSGADLYGYSGIEKMAELMMDAYTIPKDTKDIVPRKGWGCESCL